MTTLLLVVAAVAAIGALTMGRQTKTQVGLTQEDLLWLARALMGETEGSSDRAMAAVAWAMFQRWQQKSRGKTFTQLLRAYCQPINPEYATLAGRGCRAHPEMCTVAHLERRRRISTMTWEQLPNVVRDLVERFGRGEVPNPVPGMVDFAAFSFPGERVVIDGNHFGTKVRS